MIANKIIPKDYNYSHVPLLQGNFINKTHAQKGDKIINIHEQEDEQRREDFKRQVFKNNLQLNKRFGFRYKMEQRLVYEEKLKKMSPEERNRERERVEKARMELSEREQQSLKTKPLSLRQTKEVWKSEDMMEE